MRYLKAALFPVLLIAAALLGWLWWSDAVLVHRCETAGGRWDPAARTCQIDAKADRPSS